MKNEQKTMNHSGLLIGILLLCAITVFPGCQATSTSENGTGSLQDKTYSEYEQFRNDSSDRITQYEKDIAALKVRIRNENAPLKAKYESKLSGLEREYQDLVVRLGEYKDDGRDTWKRYKKTMLDSMDNLGNSLSSFFTEAKYH